MTDRDSGGSHSKENEMSDESNDLIEALEQELAKTQEALAASQALNTREEEKAETLGVFTNAEGEPVELYNHGIDNFTSDPATGRYYIGDDDIGGPDVISDYDPNIDSAVKNLKLSPRDMQLIGERSRDERGRYAADPEPERPRITEPCRCGECVDIRQANITGARWDPETGEAFVRHLCKCGEQRLTHADETPDDIQRRALFETEVMDEIIENYMERPPRW
jgi:hypothetical protein